MSTETEETGILKDASKAIGGAAADAAKSMAKLTASLGLGIPTFSAVTTSTGALGKALTPVAKLIEKQVSQYQTLTKSGVHFNGSITEMTLASTKAGLTIDKMTGLVASNSELLAGFGSTVDGGAAIFLKSMNAMRTSNKNYTGQLRNIGLTHEEIGEAMMMQQRLAMMSGRTDIANQATMAEKTAAYAKDLDLLSKLTGKSNDALKKEQSALQRQGDFRAKSMGMESDMQKAMLNAASEADAAGIGDLFKDMMIKGFPSSDQAQLAGMFGNSMNVMRQMKSAQDAGNTTEYDRLKTTLAAASIKDKLANKELAALGGTNAATAAVAEAWSKTSEAQLQIAAQVARGTISLGQVDQAMQDKFDKAKANQAAQGGEQQTGEDGTRGQQVLQGALKGQDALINAAVAVQKQVTEGFYNDFLGPVFSKVAGSVDQGAISNQISKVLDPIKRGIELGVKGFSSADGGGGVVTETAKDETLSKIATEMGNALSPNSKALANLQVEIKTLWGTNNKTVDQMKLLIESLNAANKLLDPSGEKVKPIVMPNANEKKAPTVGGVGMDYNSVADLVAGPGDPAATLPNYNKGTPGIGSAVAGVKGFADVTKDFGAGTPVMLHGNESVITESLSKELDNAFTTFSLDLAVMQKSMLETSKMNSPNDMQLYVADQLDSFWKSIDPSSKTTAPKQKRNFPTQDEAKALELKGKSQDELRNLAQLTTPSPFESTKMSQFANNAGSANNGGATRQGAINTVRTDKPAAANADMEKSMLKLFEMLQTSQRENLDALKIAMDPEVFKGMKDAMERTASGIGSQLLEQKNMTKVTKNLGGLGNAFSRGGFSI